MATKCLSWQLTQSTRWIILHSRQKKKTSGSTTCQANRWNGPKHTDTEAGEMCTLDPGGCTFRKAVGVTAPITHAKGHRHRITSHLKRAKWACTNRNKSSIKLAPFQPDAAWLRNTKWCHNSAPHSPQLQNRIMSSFAWRHFRPHLTILLVQSVATSQPDAQRPYQIRRLKILT